MERMKRILLADDNLNDAELALTALKQCPLTNAVEVVRDGVEVLDYIYRTGKYAGTIDTFPCVIFLDLKMPRMDGLEVLRRLKSDSCKKSIPVVMLTSSREETDLVRSYDLGANAFVVKPVDFEQFLHAISALGRFWATVNEPPPGSVVA